MTGDPKARPIAGRKIDPVAIVQTICTAYGDRRYLTRLRASFATNGISRAVAAHDSATLFDWLMEVFNYQGVSDAAAASYLATHGSVAHRTIGDAIVGYAGRCPKLGGFGAFAGCGYVKSRQTCSNPRAYRSCPVPTHTLRKGALNQAAYSLYLFIRDRARGDLVGHIDRILAAADVSGHPDRVARMRSALVGEIIAIYGVSHKVINMGFADLLLGAGAERPRWAETGAAMIAIDSLVHNFLRRSGILYWANSEHVFGATCYGRIGCELIVDQISRAIDARPFGRGFSAYFPRFVQHTIWRFCAEQEAAICNGRAIDDNLRCAQNECVVFERCGRIALNARAG